MTRQLDTVEPGFYRVRLVKGGPWVPVEVRCDPLTEMISVVEMGRSTVFEIALSEFKDAIVDCVIEADAFQHPLIRICWFGEKIEPHVYDKMLELIDWARKNAPEHPVLHPTQPIRLSRLPVDLII